MSKLDHSLTTRCTWDFDQGTSIAATGCLWHFSLPSLHEYCLCLAHSSNQAVSSSPAAAVLRCTSPCLDQEAADGAQEGQDDKGEADEGLQAAAAGQAVDSLSLTRKLHMTHRLGPMTMVKQMKACTQLQAGRAAEGFMWLQHVACTAIKA